MESVLAVALVVVAALWLRRESAYRRHSRALTETLDGKNSRAPSDGPLSTLAGKIDAAATELDHVRKQRQLAEANLEITLASMEDGVLVVDGRRTVRLANPSLRRMLDLAENCYGETALSALREPRVDELIAEALSAGQVCEDEIEMRVAGRPVIVAVTATPLRDAAGDVGALIIFRDVTRLTRLEQVRREFVANVSHELRTPLAIFQGYVENLQDCPDMTAEERQQVYAILEKHSKRLNALVEDLLTLARLEARRDDLDLQPLEIPAFFAELRRDWAVRVAKKEVALIVEAAPDIPTLHLDRMRFEQVFTNLLDNALKYTPPGGNITLAARKNDSGVELSVKDTGSGILSADLPHIFDRFYRADKARSRDLGGTGLGLSIVKHIAQAHGGTVAAESVLGRGTTIFIRLPASF